jgi:hypothetical protein
MKVPLSGKELQRFQAKNNQHRIAPITFDSPQVREGGFYTQALVKGLRVNEY